MAIRFYCQRCHQLLGIASRKAGTAIDCPKCGASQTVPSEEAAAAAMAMTRSARSDEMLEQASNVVVYDDYPAAIEVPRQPKRSEPPPTNPPAPAGEAPYPLESWPEGTRALPKGMILFPRRTIYLQGLLFVIVAVVAFAGGYLVGLGNAALRSKSNQEEAGRVKVFVDARLFYDGEDGLPLADEKAVIIGLPEGQRPDPLLSAQGLRPQDEASATTRKSIARIEELGGVYARTDAEGQCPIIFPDEGKYHILLISKSAARPQDTDVDELDKEQMQEYFLEPERLIGRYKYRWSTEDISAGAASIEHNFGRDGHEPSPL